MLQVDNYSRAYYLLHINVINYSGEEVAAPLSIHEHLSRFVLDPLIHMDGSHYPLAVDNAVPSETIVAPNDVDTEDRDYVLVAKDGASLITL